MRIVSELKLTSYFAICTQLEEHKSIIQLLIISSLFQNEDFKILLKKIYSNKTKYYSKYQ